MSAIKDIVILTVLLSLFFFITLGNRPLVSPDEARYSEIPREMLESGDFVTPKLNGILYFEKPPLIYWVEAASLKTFGLNEWAARGPNAVFAILTCLIVYGLGRFLYQNRLLAWSASAILASSLLFFSMAHVLTLDMALTFFLTASLSSLLLALHNSQAEGRRRLFAYLAYTSSALAILTKGLVGALFPAGILFFYFLLSHSWSQIKRLYLPSGLLLWLILIVPWHALAQYRHPDFFQFYVLEQQFLRFFTLSAGRYQPIWFFIPIFIAGFFPWIIYFFQTLTRAFQEALSEKKSPTLYLLIWLLLIFIFFSVSKSKLVPYILPCFPPAALLLARFFPELKKKGAAIGLMLFTPFFITALFWAHSHHIIPVEYHHFILILSVVIILGSLLHLISLFFSWKTRFSTLLIWAIVLDLTLAFTSTQIETSSIKPLIKQLQTRLKPDDLVVNYEHYYQDVPFYLKKTIIIVNWTNELSFGMQHQALDGLVLSEAELFKIWNGSKRIYLFTDKKYLPRLKHPNRPIYPLGEIGTDILITNRKP